MKGQDLSTCRGMSEPFFFSFNILDKKSGQMLCHAVIFSSFVVHSEEKEMKICSLDDDPRMVQFRDFVVENYGKVAKKELAEVLRSGAAQLDELASRLETLKREINQIKLEDKKV